MFILVCFTFNITLCNSVFLGEINIYMMHLLVLLWCWNW